MSPPLSHDLGAEVDRIIAARAITPHFQPIIDLHAGDIVGYEGLIRGPSDSFLHSPVALIEAAAAFGQLTSLELQTVPVLLQAYARLHLPGRIFINVTPATIAHGERFHERMLGFIHEAGLAPSRVIIELTETHAITHEHELLSAIRALREAGLVVAIDDLGEGFSGLRRWSEVRPHYVKIDRHFVDGLSQDPLRQQFIRSIMDMARMAGTRVVAEGVETESDLLLLRQLGVHCAQGYVIARPVAAPRASLRPEIVRLLRSSDHTPAVGASSARRTLAGHLARPSVTLTLAATCSDVIEAFRSDPHLYAIPVLGESGQPLGVLRSHDALLTASQLYFMDVFGKQSCQVLMDTLPLIFDANSTLQSMAAAVANIDERHLTDGFLVTHGGRYVGTGRISDLLRAVSDSQLSAARYANPLTQLPGNVPLDEHIDLLLDQQQSFVVVHWDLGSFKAFNDVYGYRLGDDLILFTADMLRSAHDPERDMLGHVGGDDFVTVYTSRDWQQRVEKALAAFDTGVRRFFSGEHLRDGGYLSLNRQGLPVFHALTTLAAGVVPVQPQAYDSHRQIARAAAESKRMAKQGPGSCCFIERRQPGSTASELPAGPVLPDTEPVPDRLAA
ncbi:GGDEF domain-containing protein [Schlegelella sp. S2-27]|uniref:GGDEF domain-containing protein n=1 Tax=Caldimonas mangrovi TaxID=2944811 RepID=A0ABT0YUC6_9BURK|nr:GGDEF domain-containing protein [Caldimonas mangrovi]